jgi:hypothetical protein
MQFGSWIASGRSHFDYLTPKTYIAITSKCASWSPLTLPCARKDRGARVSFGLAAGFHARRTFGNEGALMLFAERQGDAAIAETALSQIAERFKSLQTTASANLTFGVSRIFGFIDGKSASFARS